MRTNIATRGRRRLTWAVASVGAAAVILSACAKSNPTASGGGSGGSQPGGATAVQLQSSTVSGLGSLLDNGQGFTLYHLSSEKSGTFDNSSTASFVLATSRSFASGPDLRPRGF